MKITLKETDVFHFLSHIQYDTIHFKRCDISASLRATKCGKACGMNGLSISYMQMNRFNQLFHSILLNHGYLPNGFMKSTIAKKIKINK